MNDNGVMRYLLTDHQGSTVSVLNSSGVPVSHQRYYAFGGIRPDLSGTSNQTDFGYTGQRTMSSIGLMDYKARFYDPILGRFLQPDTITPDNNPQHLNKYTYVLNNPINKTDPTGHCGVDTFFSDIVSTAVNCYNSTVNFFKAWTANGSKYQRLDDHAVEFLGVKKALQPGMSDISHALSVVNSDIDLLKSPNGSLRQRNQAVGNVMFFGLAVAAAITPSPDDLALLGGGTAAMKAESALFKNCLNSFSADTDVMTSNGTQDIVTIKVGDYVLAWNEAENSLGFYPVTATIHHTDQVIIELILDGEHIETTPEHPFYVEGKGWVDAKDLKTGMHIHRADGSTGIVWLQWTTYRQQEMYNLTVDTAHTYFVGQGRWLVHNIDECNINIADLGHTGRYIPKTEAEAAAMEKVMRDPLLGAQKLKLPMNDPRWPKEDGWGKFQRIIDDIVIHFNYSDLFDEFDDFKFK